MPKNNVNPSFPRDYGVIRARLLTYPNTISRNNRQIFDTLLEEQWENIHLSDILAFISKTVEV